MSSSINRHTLDEGDDETLRAAASEEEADDIGSDEGEGLLLGESGREENLDSATLLAGSSFANTFETSRTSTRFDDGGDGSLKTDLRRMLKIGAPNALSSFFRSFQQITDLAVLGRLGTDYLAAASIALVYMNILEVPIYRAVAPTINILCSQALGAGNKALVGEWLQLGLLVDVLICLPMMAILLFATGPLLIALGISVNVSALAARFSAWMAVWFIPYSASAQLQAYFQSQSNVYPALFWNFIFIFVNLFFNILFVFGIGGFGGYGFIGSPIATTASRLLMSLCYFVHTIIIEKYHVSTWGGWTWRAFQRKRAWEFVVNQFLPMLVASYLEEVQLTVVAAVAIVLGPASVAVHNSMLQLYFLLSAFMFGLQSSCVVVLGRYLGANKPVLAKRIAKVTLATAIVIGLFVATLFLTLSEELGRIFSRDSSFISLFSRLCHIAAIGYLLVGLFYTAMSVLEGQGRPSMMAVAFVVGGWLVSVPLSWLLGIKAKLGLVGIWWALIVGYVVITVIVGVTVLRTDWDACATEAVERSRHGGSKVTAIEAPSSPAISPSHSLESVGEE